MVHVLVTMKDNPNEPEALAEYKRRATAIRDGYGAELVLRMNVGERLVGALAEESIRLLRFPSADHVRGWLNDPRYLEIIPLREKGYERVTVTILEDIS
ncbi:DUF1330 domain-containing protein [Tumebacillus flagellatus]|uniref:DUF1330 domain-containing protein n=1 Tax=Tumebacillus flagellatus TaxID=1157490 RepID=A0A074MEZ2_9BACL|nr:DUF1330 domain-containing protein [Tumebacillus flagellatus]KEO84357.1 hypothetical protein EL26_04430 [Tumebacillus flagellatus]